MFNIVLELAVHLLLYNMRQSCNDGIHFAVIMTINFAWIEIYI